MSPYCSLSIGAPHDGVIWVSSDTDCTHVDLLLKVYENVLGYYSMFEHAGSQLVSSGNLMDKTVTFVIKYNNH